jgi:formamidase
MTRAIGIAAVQVAPIPYDPAATWDKLAHEVRALAISAPSMDLLVFPELYLHAVGSWGDRWPRGYDRQVAETIPGPTTDRLCALAQEVGKWLVPGSIYEQTDGGVHNTAVVISPSGELVASYRKLFPWRPLEDSMPGDGYTVFDIPDVGRFGLMICYDGWYPEVARTLAWMGAEVILQPTLTKTVDREQELVIARANAIVNQAWLISPNYGGIFGTGRSLIVDPEGVVTAAGGSGEEVLTQIVDLDRARLVREHGTAGLNMMWKQLRDGPVPPYPPAAEGYARGAVMRGLGPLGSRRSVHEGERGRGGNRSRDG